MDAVARYKEVVDRLTDLQQDREIKWYLNEILPHINNSVRIMVGHLDAIVQNRKVLPSKQAKDIILRTSLLILDSLMTVKLTPKVKQYAHLWLELATNWNLQVGFDDNLRIVLNAIGTLLDISTTLSELLETTKLITNRLKMMVNTESSGVKLAGMFMDTIREMVEEDKQVDVVEGKKG